MPGQEQSGARTDAGGDRSVEVRGPEELLGTRLGRCRLTRHLSRGGMGDIFAAEHVHLGRQIAVKIPRLDNPNPWFYQQRLLLEARFLARLSHMNIVGVHDLAFTKDGLAYLVMEYLDGKALDEVLVSRPVLEPGQALRLVREAARAIGACHRAGILVGDIKPENIMVVGGPLVGLPPVGTVWVKLIDLGGAHSFDSSSGQEVAPPAVRMGTPAYCSPELLLGRPLGPPSDVYALGVLTYELLSGQAPFCDPDDEVVLRNHVEVSPAPLSSVCPAVRAGGALERFVGACLAKDPGARPAGAVAFLDWLDRALGEEGLSPMASGGRRAALGKAGSSREHAAPTRPIQEEAPGGHEAREE